MTRHTVMENTTHFFKRQPFSLPALGCALAVLTGIQPIAPAFAADAAAKPETTSEARQRQVPPNAQRAFARTAAKGHCTIEALKESGEHGGGLCPTTEDVSRFTREGNEAFGACMTLWNQHRWDEARNAMLAFSAAHPDDPWRGESDLHVACYHKFRGENSEAEVILAGLYAQNKGNPIGRRSLVRLIRVYFDTYRYQAAYEALLTLVQLDPIENEKSYALSWLSHLSRSWMNAAAGRECGPKAFGFAAWVLDNGDLVRQNRENARIRSEIRYREREHGAYLPPLSFAQVAEAYPWAAQKGASNGVSLANMRDLLARNGWTMETRRVSYDELRAYVSEDRVAVLCLPAPSPARFVADDKVASAVNHKLSTEIMFAGGREAADLGHYMVLVKATSRNAWLLDPENGLIQKDALALKDLWLRGNGRGLAVFLSRPATADRLAKSARPGAAEAVAALPGTAAEPAAESAFFGGCCGHETINDDVCPDDTPKSCGSRGMPIHQVNTINLNYQVVDTPIWIETPGGTDLDLTLTYNNRESYNAKYPIADVQLHPFGCRWSAPYDSNYALDPASNILVRFPNGMETYFDRQESGSYLPRDNRYLDHFDLTVLTNSEIRVDLKGGLARYFYHTLDPDTNLLQQTLYRVENRFGTGINITRDTGGRILEVKSDVTGASLNYDYNTDGTVGRVFELDGAGNGTGRHALFSYELTNGVPRLLTMTDMAGQSTTFAYGPQTNNVTVNTNGVYTTTDNVISYHHITAYTWPNGGRWGFDLHQTKFGSYDEPMKLVITDPVGSETVYNSYSYDKTGPIGLKDRNGASRFWGLDEVNGATLGKYVTLVNDCQGGNFSREGDYTDYRQYSVSGKRDLTFERLVTEPVRERLGYEISAVRDYTNTTNAPRKDTWYTYLPFTGGHRLVMASNAVYRTVGGTLQRTDLWTESLEQDANEEVVRTVDRAGNTVYLDRNTNRLVTAVRIKPAGQAEKTMWKAFYNPRGQMITQTVDEALTAVAAYAYDSVGRLTRILHPDGTSETFGYNPSNQFLTSYTNRTGQAVSFSRDAMGRPTRTSYGDGTFTTNVYGCCAATAVTDRHGVTARFTYDYAKRLETAVLPMNATADTCVQYGYLGEGEVSSIGYGNSFMDLASRTFGYAVTNGITRLVSRTTPTGKTTDTWSHTFTGLPATRTDGRGVVTSNVWDAAKGQLLRKTVNGSAAGLADVTVSYLYDSLDRLTNTVKTVSGQVTWSESHRYDSRSRLARTDTRVQNLIPGQTPLAYSVTYSYNARGMVSARVLSAGTTLSLATTYTYDPAVPRLASLSSPYGGGTFAVAAYGYDAAGRLSSVAVKNSAQEVIGRRSYGYDPYSRLASITVSNQTARLWGADYAYDIDRLSAVTSGTGAASTVTRYAYDLQGQLTGATGYTPSNTLALVERFRYDAVGNLSDRSLSAPPPPAAAEGAVALFRNRDDEATRLDRHSTATLTGTADPAAALSLPLFIVPVIAVETDGYGNWVAPFVPLTVASNGLARVQLKAEKAGQPPRYRIAEFTARPSLTEMGRDGDGALLTLPALSGTGASQTLRYDSEGYLTSVSNGTSLVQENWYDDAGRRIAKREGGVLTLYVWAGMDILATANASGSLREYYTRGPGIAGDVGSLLAETTLATGETVFLHSNHRGDVVLATDRVGAPIGGYTYTAFGLPLSATGTYTPRFGFSSKERDASGLVYYGFRYYSPVLCRWINADPIREDGGLNLYRFCGNDPVNFVDLFGLDCNSDNIARWTKIGAIVGSVAGGIIGGGGGAALGLFTGPGAVFASPSGATAGAIAGAGVGALAGAASGASAAVLANAVANWWDNYDADADPCQGFKKNPQGNNTAKNSEFEDAMDALGIQRTDPLWQQIHREISGQGLSGRNDIINAARLIRGF